MSQNPEKKAFVDNIFSVLFFMVGFYQFYISFQNQLVGLIFYFFMQIKWAFIFQGGGIFSTDYF